MKFTTLARQPFDGQDRTFIRLHRGR
jgi:hypothetical protein